jgi:hypothetical protein
MTELIGLDGQHHPIKPTPVLHPAMVNAVTATDPHGFVMYKATKFCALRIVFVQKSPNNLFL